MFCTVFFCALIINNGCKTVDTDEGIKKERSLVSKYIVGYSIKSERTADEYHKDAQTIFFPILELNSDGNLLSNYEQLYTESNNYLVFSSKDNLNTAILAAANLFCSKFDFNEPPLLNTLPVDLKKSYFIRFYYYVDYNSIEFNSVYVRSSIEYINPKDGTNTPVSAWKGEAFFSFDKSIVKATFLDVAVKKVFEYAFDNYSYNGKFHILDM